MKISSNPDLIETSNLEVDRRVPRKERAGRSGWRLGDRLGVAVQRGVGSGGTFRAGGRLRGEREKVENLWDGRGVRDGTGVES